MDHGMGPDFEADKNEGDDGKKDLQALGALLPGAELLAAPLRRGTRAQAPDPGKDGKVDERSDGRERQHRNADGVLVEAACGSIDATCRRQGGKADDDADSADGENRCADALQQGYDEGCAAQTTQVDRGAGGFF